MTKRTRMNFKTAILYNQQRFQCQPALVDKHRQPKQVQPVQFLCCWRPRCPFPDAQFYIWAKRPAPKLHEFQFRHVSRNSVSSKKKGEVGNWWSSSKWKLAVFREMVFLIGLRFMYVNQACHISTNQVHVGGALDERYQLNKSSLKICLCVLFYYL